MASLKLIAFVDDDPSVRDAIKGFLTAFDYCVEVFSSAEEFLDSGIISVTRCLITDLQLNGISGLHLLEHLRSIGSIIPTLVITAHADERTRNRVRELGARLLFSKPVAMNEFLAAVEDAFNNNGDGEESRCPKKID